MNEVNETIRVLDKQITEYKIKQTCIVGAVTAEPEACIPILPPELPVMERYTQQYQSSPCT